MADIQRFSLFASFIKTAFPTAQHIYDVAGGMGALNEALHAQGRTALTFDVRHKHLPVPYAQRLFAIDEPCRADAIVGLHPDGATQLIVEYAALHHIPFAIVPCCSENGMAYKPWMNYLTHLAQTKGFSHIYEASLPIKGRVRILVGTHEPSLQKQS